MLQAGVKPDYIYKDFASGHKNDRPGLNACLKSLQSGNTLVYENLMNFLDKLKNSLPDSKKLEEKILFELGLDEKYKGN